MIVFRCPYEKMLRVDADAVVAAMADFVLAVHSKIEG
jgi:hypothetical protein